MVIHGRDDGVGAENKLRSQSNTAAISVSTPVAGTCCERNLAADLGSGRLQLEQLLG